MTDWYCRHHSEAARVVFGPLPNWGQPEGSHMTSGAFATDYCDRVSLGDCIPLSVRQCALESPSSPPTPEILLRLTFARCAELFERS
jgi:hypothetical protein